VALECQFVFGTENYITYVIQIPLSSNQKTLKTKNSHKLLGMEDEMRWKEEEEAIKGK
jgi:hypothetical protein